MPLDANGRQDDDGCILALSTGPQVTRVPETIGKLNDRTHAASLDASARPATLTPFPPGQPRCAVKPYL
jgi:hypothetical protein